VDEDANREFLQHEYNRDGDSYRSPWTNKYWPPLNSEFFPSQNLRGLEEKANQIFT
jgi:capping protein beta